MVKRAKNWFFVESLWSMRNENWSALVVTFEAVA